MTIIDFLNGIVLPVIKWVVISTVVMTLVERSRNTSAATLHAILLVACSSILFLLLSALLLPQVNISLLPSDFQKSEISVSGYDNAYIFLIGLYLCVALVLLMKTLVNVISIGNLGEFRNSKKSDKHIELLVSAAHDLRYFRKVELRHSSLVKSPLTFGIFRPVIVMPQSSFAWSDSKITRFMLHELSHVKRCDWFWKIAIQVLCSVFWFIPTVWVMSRKTAWYAELSCDDEVIRSKHSEIDYANDLLEMAISIMRPPKGAIALMEASEHYKRISAVLDNTRSIVVNNIKFRLYVSVVVVITCCVGPFQFGLQPPITGDVTSRFYSTQTIDLLIDLDDSSKPFVYKGLDNIDGLAPQVLSRTELESLKTELLPKIQKERY